MKKAVPGIRFLILMKQCLLEADSLKSLYLEGRNTHSRAEGYRRSSGVMLGGNAREGVKLKPVVVHHFACPQALKGLASLACYSSSREAAKRGGTCWSFR